MEVAPNDVAAESEPRNDDRVDGGSTPSAAEVALMADPSDVAWVEFADAETRRGHAVCLEAANALLRTLAILIPGYLAALALLRSFGLAFPWAAVLPLGCWAISVALCVIALVPWEWRFEQREPESIKSAYGTLVVQKRRCIAGAVAAVAMGIAGAGTVWILLGRSLPPQ